MKGSKQTVVVSFDTEIDGKDVNIEFERTTKFGYDPSYGADADGNRGVPMWSIEEDDWARASVAVELDGEMAVELHNLSPMEQVSVLAKIGEYMTTHEPEMADDDSEYEPDYEPDDDRDDDFCPF